MSVSAVPDYLKIDWQELPPGHRYGTFFPVWNKHSWSKAEPTEKNNALESVFKYEKFKSLSESLLKRQKNTTDNLGDELFRLPAESISPFMTGTGMEHPLENGFAFLNPYGLPYLPGSGIKGVLRRTAEYLRDKEFSDSDFGWDQLAIDTLFGLEPKNDKDASRGALVFWDVYIQPKDYKLGMDILTPHFTDYYAGNGTPHESGQPVPVPFLVVPPSASFTFHIQCNREFILDEKLKDNWRDLVKALLEHSFDWLGFGAKTASGYGQLKADVRALNLLKEKEETRKKKSMSEIDKIKDQIQSVWSAEKSLNRKQAGGPLDNVIGEAVKAAVGLSEVDRREIFLLAKESLIWLGKDKKKIKEKLAPLNISIS